MTQVDVLVLNCIKMIKKIFIVRMVIKYLHIKSAQMKLLIYLHTRGIIELLEYYVKKKILPHKIKLAKKIKYLMLYDMENINIIVY